MRSWTQAVRERVSLPALPNVHPGNQTLDEGTTIRAKYAAVSLKQLCVSALLRPLLMMSYSRFWFLEFVCLFGLSWRTLQPALFADIALLCLFLSCRV